MLHVTQFGLMFPSIPAHGKVEFPSRLEEQFSDQVSSDSIVIPIWTIFWILFESRVLITFILLWIPYSNEHLIRCATRPVCHESHPRVADFLISCSPLLTHMAFMITHSTHDTFDMNGAVYYPSVLVFYEWTRAPQPSSRPSTYCDPYARRAHLRRRP